MEAVISCYAASMADLSLIRYNRGESSMENVINSLNIAFYLLKKVQIQLKDSSTKTGVLSNYDPTTGILQIDEESVQADSINDIEYVAIVDDFHTYKGYGEIGNIRFSVEDLHPDFTLPDLLYGEFICTVSCHLYLKDGEICAKDIRLIKKRHTLNYDCAKGKRLIYRYNNGVLLIGTLSENTSDYQLILPSGKSSSLDLDHIVDVTKAPEVNDYLYVRLSTDSIEHSGLVSAVNDTTVVLINSESAPELIDLVHSTAIRYRGTVYIKKSLVNGKTTRKVMIGVGSNCGDDGYLCKLPYARNPESITRVKDGDIVSFIPGINGRYYIAKDVDVIQSESEHELDLNSEHEYFGIILTVDFSKENGYGYVGNCFISKACGKPVSGHARFSRSQLDFKIEYNKTFVVKYTATENAETNLRIINRISLYQVLDSTKYGIIDVSDDGKINAIPLYKAGTSYFENRDVDVYCLDGRVVSGKLCSYSDLGISICSGHDNSENTTDISFADIEDIRIIGTISQFYQNGTGYVDNTFFFHINEMEQSVEAQHIRRGMQVSFSLRNARKGNHVDCGNIRVLPEKRIEVYVLSYQNQKYTVVNADKYGRSIHFYDDAFEVPFSGYNTFRDPRNEDYRAILTIQRRNGSEECTSIRTLDARPKLRYGIVTELNSTDNTVSIASLSSYRKKPSSVVYPFSMQSRIDRISNPEKKDYQVLYYTTIQNGITVATIVWVELKETYDKCFFGYIEQFFEDRAFGWITPGEYIDTPWKKRPKNFGVYCRYSSLVEIPEGTELYSPSSILRVCYTLDFDSKITRYNPKIPAKQVWILESVDRPKSPAPAPSPAPKPVPKPIKREMRTETRLIPEMTSPTTTFAGEKYEYGLVNIFTTQYALINTQYYNRNHFPDAVYNMGDTVYFVPKETIITPELRLKTGNYSYLVRYVRKGTITNPTTGLEQPTIDSSYPLEVVYAFSKKQCASIVVDGEKITIEYIGDIIPEPDPTSDDAPEFVVGESTYFMLKDGSVLYGVYSGEDDNTYFLADGKAIDKSSISRLFRFGVISELSIESGVATINNYFDFNLTVAEPKMVSILKNQQNHVRLHIMYSCESGKITEVCRVSKQCLSCLVWDAGIVTASDNAAHSITIDTSIRHYLSVMSDGVNTYVNNGTILNRTVYIKQVFHPYLETNDIEPSIIASAVDVRCQEEELKIQYDEGKDVYWGYRNPTISFPVFGSAQALHDMIGETTLVTFRVSEDMYSLEGYINDEKLMPNEEIIDVFDSSRIQQEALCQLLLRKEETEQLAINKISLNADSNQDQVQRAVDFFISKSRHLIAIKIALEYPEYDVLTNMESLLRSEVQNRCTAIELDSSSYYGEQAFYIATVLRYPTSAKGRGKSSNARFSNYDYLYRLFSQDFESRELLVKYIQSGHPAKKANLANLFRKPCLQIKELVAHLMLLDTLNFDIICSLIQNNQQLSEEIISYAKYVDDMISYQDITEVIRALQDRYLRDKRRFSDRIIAMINRENICDDLNKLILNMQKRFLKLVCKEDMQRFESLLRICTNVIGYIDVSGFVQQEQLLQQAYREVSILEEDILAHPCKESVEILVCSKQFDTVTNILETVKRDILFLLNSLYKDASKPRIQIQLNENNILPGLNNFWIIVENGSTNENLQPAENIQLELESFTLGFMPQTKVSLGQNRILCGEQLAVQVVFELNGEANGILEFGWTARYEYTSEFQSNGNTKKAIVVQESKHPLQLQIDSAFAEKKIYGVDNPYQDPARGQPLIGKEMFFGREKEKQRILEFICTSTDEKRFIPGSAVIIHGQKKSGKTSLVNQIKNYIKEDVVLSDSAILLNFSNILTDTGGVQQLDFFQRTFYAAIMSRFKHEIKRCHPDIIQMLRENDIIIPNLLHPDYRDTWPVAFDAFFQDFYNVDNGKHTVLLFMDEFTLLCTTILLEVQRFPEKASLNNIPNFIKTFSQYGFIQIIIGHEAMMRALNTLGVLNHTAEFAKSIEISALDDKAARALVTSPMQDRFGYNVYESELGRQAVERLLDLSGRNPAYLMRLCNKMFIYFTDPQKCARTQLLLSDVSAMVQGYTSELLLSDFDILLMEDGDDAMEAEKRSTYHYLKTAALLSLSSFDKRTADSSEITRELSRDFNYTIDQIEKTRNILEARRVISITNGGRVKINTALFSEYIYQKNGLR